MGRHGTVAGSRSGWSPAPAPLPPAPASPGRSPRRIVLSLLAMAAIAGMALVTVIDPYAGATAATDYQQPVLAPSSGVQRYDIDGGYVLIDPKRDVFRAVVTGGASGGDAGTASAGTVTPVGTAQLFAAKAVSGRGWAPSEFACLVALWNRESGWNTHASNPSGAYGIPQALPGSKMGAGWQDDYRVQIGWGIGYIAGLYGSPCGALAHSNAKGWY